MGVGKQSVCGESVWFWSKKQKQKNRERCVTTNKKNVFFFVVLLFCREHLTLPYTLFFVKSRSQFCSGIERKRSEKKKNALKKKKEGKCSYHLTTTAKKKKRKKSTSFIGMGWNVETLLLCKGCILDTLYSAVQPIKRPTTGKGPMGAYI